MQVDLSCQQTTRPEGFPCLGGSKGSVAPALTEVRTDGRLVMPLKRASGLADASALSSGEAMT